MKNTIVKITGRICIGMSYEALKMAQEVSLVVNNEDLKTKNKKLRLKNKQLKEKYEYILNEYNDLLIYYNEQKEKLYWSEKGSEILNYNCNAVIDTLIDRNLEVEQLREELEYITLTGFKTLKLK